MPVDLSEFDALSDRTPPECRLASLMNDLGDLPRKQLEAALAQGYGDSTVSKWLWKHHGKKIHPSTVKKHRNGECCCE